MSSTREFGVVVRIMQLSMTSPSGLFHWPHRPGERKDIFLTDFKTVRLLYAPHCSPFVKAVRGDEASFAQD
ncbi:MAG TPA: hypothetical protein VJN90_03720 [Candidatus Acidoferrales bacterium]|nr:hypothetical protein [Candidatus Acidoferrales bacterium]